MPYIATVIALFVALLLPQAQYVAPKATVQVGQYVSVEFTPFEPNTTVKPGDEVVFVITTNWSDRQAGTLDIILDSRFKWTTIGSKTCRGVPGIPQRLTCPTTTTELFGTVGPDKVWVVGTVKQTLERDPLALVVEYDRYLSGNSVDMQPLARLYFPRVLR